MKMIKKLPLATSLVLSVLAHDSLAVKSQEDPSDPNPAPPAVKKRKATQAPDLFSPRPTAKSAPNPKRPRTAQQRIIVLSQDDDNTSPPASGSSTCDPADDQDQSTPEERISQVLAIVSPEFRNDLYRNQITTFVWGFESGRIFQQVLTEWKRIDTDKRFYAMNFVTSRLQYPQLLDEDLDEITEAFQNYDGSEILVPNTPPATPRR